MTTNEPPMPATAITSNSTLTTPDKTYTPMSTNRISMTSISASETFSTTMTLNRSKPSLDELLAKYDSLMEHYMRIVGNITDFYDGIQPAVPPPPFRK